MKFCLYVASVPMLAIVGHAQIGVPAFTADRVLPSGSARLAPLAPGMLVSIYGQNLGPERGCTSQANVRGREVIYPQELCGVQVLVGNRASGLLYVQDKQINFQVPQEVALEGMTELLVVYQGRSNSAVRVPVGLGKVTLSVEGTARVGGPIWIKVEMPYRWPDVQYPSGLPPFDFGCNQMEVRQNGALLPRVVAKSTMAVTFVGSPCGGIAIPGNAPPHTGRLPLHLQYHFEKPGIYEVRYTLKRMRFESNGDDVAQQSAWTRFEVLPAQARPRRTPATDPAEILTDYLPSVVGFSDAAGLQIVLGYLYHPNDFVRRYAQSVVSYWPQQEIDTRVAELVRTKGPTDALVNLIRSPKPDLTDSMLPYLASDDPVLLRGAILGVSRVVSDPQQTLPAESRSRVENALLRAVEHVVRIADVQTLTDFAAALGSVHDARAHDVLWNLFERNVAADQSLIAISWHKDLRDLPRFGALLVAPAGNATSRQLGSIPYALRNSYGEAAVPFLEAAIKDSGNVWVRSGCARELVIAGRPAGFAFIVDAMEGNRANKREMIEFMRERFPKLKGANETEVLAFAKARAL
jgi:hypothetical protein